MNNSGTSGGSMFSDRNFVRAMARGGRLMAHGLTAASLVLLVGCTSFSSTPVRSGESSGAVAPATSPSMSPSILIDEGGFRVELLDEVNDGENLEVRARISGTEEWSARDVAVRLTGLRYGEVLHKSQAVVGALVPEHLDTSVRRGDTRTVAVEIPASGITDYQFDLLWGDEASLVVADASSERSLPQGSMVAENTTTEIQPARPRHNELLDRQMVQTTAESTAAVAHQSTPVLTTDETIRARMQPEMPSVGVALVRSTLSKRYRCPDASECMVSHELQLTIQNNGSSVASDIVLGVGYVLSDEQLDAVPADEQPLPLQGIVLQPGEQQVLPLALESELTEAQDEAVRPAVRILSFQ